MVGPQPAGDGVGPPPCVYELVERDELPTVDLCRSLGRVCCSGRAGSSPDAGGHWSVKASWLASFFLSPFIIIMSLRDAEAFGPRLAVLALLANLPMWAIQFQALRFDVVRLVTRTPDFWYFAANSALWCALLGVYLNGLRSLLALVFFMTSLTIGFVDADAMFANRLVSFAVLGVAVNVAVVVLINRRAIDGAASFPIAASSGSTSLQVEDVIISGLLTNTFYLIRNAHRRRWELAEQRRVRCSLLRCIVYRRRACLRLVDESARFGAHAPASCVVSPTVVRMVSVAVLTTFPAHNTLVRVDLSGSPWRRRTRVAIATAAWASVILTAVAFLGPMGTSDHARYRLPAATAALGLTLTCCALFWSLCQRQLLRHIAQSFDFLYLSVQLTLAHVCVCEFVDWDERQLAVLCSWLWMHVVLTSDALTPVVRAKTGLRERHLAPVLAVFIAGLLGLALYLVFFDTKGTGTRVVVAFGFGPRKFEVRPLRVFLSRFVSIFWWSLRVLGRVWTAREGDMIELRMRVAYATNSSAGYNHDTLVERFRCLAGGASSELRAPEKTNQVAPMPKVAHGGAT